MGNKDLNLNQQWTKSLRKNFKLFIKDKNPTISKYKEFISNLDVDQIDVNLRFTTGIYYLYL